MLILGCTGGAGDDLIYGGAGNDVNLVGRSGSMTRFMAVSGSDALDGGLGDDLLGVGGVSLGRGCRCH